MNESICLVQNHCGVKTSRKERTLLASPVPAVELNEKIPAVIP